MTIERKKFVIICSIFVICFSIGILKIVLSKQEQDSYCKAETISPFLNDGDIICRLGDRFWSLYFKDISLTDKRFSHVGIARYKDGQFYVINAEGRAIAGKDFVNMVSLQEFLDCAVAIGVYRLKGVDGKLISDTAMQYLGRPFDWRFDLTEEDSLYCSELLFVVLKRIAPKIVLKKTILQQIGREIIPIEACSNSDDFKEILYVNKER